jgi:hypothetical protein
MSYSISPSTPFSSINWDSFENRPQVGGDMPICEEKNWYEDSKCCMDYYSIEHVRDVANDYGLADTPEVKFLDAYPCINGPEIDFFADEIESMEPKIIPEPEEEHWPSFDCIPKKIFDGLIKTLPKQLIDSIKPYVCPM